VEQRRALVSCLKRAADVLKGRGVRLAVEPLNTRVDHPGYYLSSTVEGLDIIDEVGRPEIRIVYDIYHSAVMDEEIGDVLAGRLDRVAHVHLADSPGRHEPGSGKMDWRRRLAWLEKNGYRGMIGLEYKPTGSTSESLRALLS
jgi:hydroxypyruvate isomerase